MFITPTIIVANPIIPEDEQEILYKESQIYDKYKVSDGLTIGQIIGIVIGAIVLLTILVFIPSSK